MIAALLCFGCSNDPIVDQPPENMPAVGSVYEYNVSYMDSSFIRTDSITRGPFAFEGKQFVIQVGDDVFRPTLFAYESNGDVGRYLELSDSWVTMGFGSRKSGHSRDSTFRGKDLWKISEHALAYRDTLLEIDGQLLAGVKAESIWSSSYRDPDGTIIDSLSANGIEYDVWIPSIGYFGLMVSDPGTPNEYVARLNSFELK